MPIEPPPSRWAFPDEGAPADGEVVGVGADLEPGTLLAAYRAGVFPMPVERKVVGWWSPSPRGVLPLDGLVVSRSLRKAARHYEIRVDTSFVDVVAACADRRRPGFWISDDIATAYRRLHHLGWAHSVEAWSVADGVLAGGLYGIAVGGLFAGESMFHHRTDASKVALMALVDLLRDDGAGGAGRLLDVQWRTDHLATLGVVEIERDEYRRRLTAALPLPLPAVFADRPA